ncbi:MAG: TIR domain-containing protein, partial [Planctomycetota bacterium]|nr:TIR domain-containing protein [Planctomycetota bacterium]
MRIFISYGRKDAADFAVKLAAWLRSQGIEPWLDVENGIPIGAPFDIRIEVGISGSDMLVALLSPWSLRPEGFCRNELLFAQWQSKPIIPVRIADVCPPIQIISLNFIDAASDPQAVFKQLLPVIEQVGKTGKMALRDWPSVAAGGPWWADRGRMNFEEELARHGGSFVGRQWLFEQIRQWAARPESRLLLLTADAGVGKSAIAAQMTARLNVRGVHFCSRSNIESCRPAAWIGQLVYQLAAQFPAYRKRLDQLPAPEWAHPESVFRTAIADPLRDCQGELDAGEPWVFMVDGLDELIAAAGPDLATLLADSSPRLPPWLRIIATSRPDQSVLAMFRLDGVQRSHMDTEGQENVADLGIFVNREVESLPETVLPPEGRSALAERILSAAQGNFLFARMTLEGLCDPEPKYRLSPDEVGVLPNRLGGLYHAMFRKRFPEPERYESHVLPLLDCLVAARGPIPEALLKEACGLDSTVATKGLRALSQFLGRSGDDVALFHKSVADWLVDAEASAEFVVQRRLGLERLVSACLREYREDPPKASRYTVSHLPAHLAEARRGVELRDLLLDFAFLRTKILTSGPQPLLDDFDLAQAPGALPSAEGVEAARLIQGAIRLSANVLAQDGDQLAGQLHGRLLAVQSPAIQGFLENIKTVQRDPWLRPLVGSLTAPGGPLLRTLEGHGD